MENPHYKSQLTEKSNENCALEPQKDWLRDRKQNTARKGFEQGKQQDRWCISYSGGCRHSETGATSWGTIQ